MFRGSVPQHVQNILGEAVRSWDCKDIYIGCSGNFTIERMIGLIGSFRIHGNDVTLYSSILGAYYAGGEFEIRFEPVITGFDFIADYMGDKESRLASVMLASNLTDGISAKGEAKKNRHYGRMKGAYLDAWPQLHAQTVDRIKGDKFRLESYVPEDVLTWIDKVPRDQALIAYPPFEGVGAANQFANDTKKLEMLFKWNKPDFTMLDDKIRLDFLRKITEFKYWAFGGNRPIPELEDYLIGHTKLTNRGTTVYTYAAKGPLRVITPWQKTAQVSTPRLNEGEKIGDEITLSVLDYAQFQTLRSQYMNIGIRPGAASLAVGVLVDGALIGVYAFSTHTSSVMNVDPTMIYMLSDFPVAPTDYSRLSKLVLYAALSKESKILAERVARRRVRTVETIAYSNNPVSMKYRGIFKLKFRRDNPTTEKAWGATIDLDTNDYYARRYQLEYKAEIGKWALADGLAEWKKKHSKV